MGKAGGHLNGGGKAHVLGGTVQKDGGVLKEEQAQLLPQVQHLGMVKKWSFRWKKLQRWKTSSGTTFWTTITEAMLSWPHHSLRDGLLPCMGAGADALAAWFGMEIPGVYVAKAFEVASGYPNECTTGYTTLKQWVGTQWECESTYKDGVPGGTVVAADATPPLRVMLQTHWGPTKATLAQNHKPVPLQARGLAHHSPPHLCSGCQVHP